MTLDTLTSTTPTSDALARKARELEAAGWRCHRDSEGFNGTVGPFWFHETEGAGLLIEPRHCNPHLGTLHGGVVMTFADIGLGVGVARVLREERQNSVTAALNTQFVSIGQVGDFITCRAEVIRHSRHLVFVRGLICAGERTIANVDGIFKVLDPRPVGARVNHSPAGSPQEAK